MSTDEDGNCTAYKYSNILYGDNKVNTFNLYLPNKITYIDDIKPAVVFLHGGGWNSGYANIGNADDYDEYFEEGFYEDIGSYVVKYGLPVISINYSLLEKEEDKKLSVSAGYIAEDDPDDKGYVIEKSDSYRYFKKSDNTINSAVEDLTAFFNYLSQNYEFLKVDNSFAIIDGFSVGANVALLYCLSTNNPPIPIKALIDRSGPCNMASKGYIDFFSKSLVKGSYTAKCTWLRGANVSLTMESNDNDGEGFFKSMLEAATGEEFTFNDIKAYCNGTVNVPDSIKQISPLSYNIPNNFPYITMFYPGDCGPISDEIKLKTRSQKKENETDKELDFPITGDPICPRLDAESFAIKLDRSSNKLLQVDANNRIVANYPENNPTFVLYKGNKDQGFSFVGSAKGGQMFTLMRANFNNNWEDEELAAIKEITSYTIEEICGIFPPPKQ